MDDTQSNIATDLVAAISVKMEAAALAGLFPKDLGIKIEFEPYPARCATWAQGCVVAVPPTFSFTWVAAMDTYNDADHGKLDREDFVIESKAILDNVD